MRDENKSIYQASVWVKGAPSSKRRVVPGPPPTSTNAQDPLIHMPLTIVHPSLDPLSQYTQLPVFQACDHATRQSVRCPLKSMAFDEGIQPNWQQSLSHPRLWQFIPIPSQSSGKHGVRLSVPFLVRWGKGGTKVCRTELLPPPSLVPATAASEMGPPLSRLTQRRTRQFPPQ